MLREGMQIARINMSFTDSRDQFLSILNNIDEATLKTGLDCANLVELQGPAMRTQMVISDGQAFKEEDEVYKVQAGQFLRITTNVDLVKRFQTPDGQYQSKNDLLVLNR